MLKSLMGFVAKLVGITNSSINWGSYANDDDMVRCSWRSRVGLSCS